MAGNRPVVSAAGAALFAMALGACATIYNPATGRNETVLSTGLEVALGHVARAQMGLTSLRMGRVDPAQLERVQAIGRRIARVSDRQDLPYQFGLIKDKNLNAFALPGGTIYVHSALAEKADDDELAAVMAHEVGHVAARHAAKHLQADLGFALLAHIAEAAGAAPESAQVADSIYGLLRDGYSRRDELEADRLGLRYALKADYNPEGMVTFFEKMLAEEPEDALSRAAVWKRTHPLTSERIAEARSEIEKLRPAKFCPACGESYGSRERFCAKDGTALREKRGP